MTYVVDASVAIKWFVREDLHEQALLLLDRRDELQAPDLIVTEVTNIAWKKCILGEITHDQAELITSAIRGYIPSLHSSASLNERALQIALTLNHPVYDCLYIVCADDVDGVVITADRRLQNRVQNTIFENLVRYVGDSDFLQAVAQPVLRISIRKLQQIIRESDLLSDVSRNLHDKLSAGIDFVILSSEDLKLIADSPNYHRLESTIKTLSSDELADVVALSWLGKGDETDWKSVRNRAEAMLQMHGDSYIPYICSVMSYLEDGIAIFQGRT